MKSLLPRLGILLSLLIVFSLIAVACSSSAKVQSPKRPQPESEVVVKTGTDAAIIGGLKALYENIIYPEEARQRGLEATIKAQVLVTKTGKVDQISFDQDYGYGFEEAARQALRRVKYRPGTQNGEPISMFITVPVRFEL